VVPGGQKFESVHAVCVVAVVHTYPLAQEFWVSEFKGQYEPGPHAAQVVLAPAAHAVVWYVPAGHTEHVVGAVLPVTQKLPAGQLVCVDGVGQ
jgi:hypothetical protein